MHRPYRCGETTSRRRSSRGDRRGGGEEAMRARGWIGSLVLVTAVLAGCSSGGKGSSPVAATGGGVSVAGALPSGVVVIGTAKQTVAADLAFVEVGIGSDNGLGGGLSQIITGPN